VEKNKRFFQNTLSTVHKSSLSQGKKLRSTRVFEPIILAQIKTTAHSNAWSVGSPDDARVHEKSNKQFRRIIIEKRVHTSIRGEVVVLFTIVFGIATFVQRVIASVRTKNTSYKQNGKEKFQLVHKYCTKQRDQQLLREPSMKTIYICVVHVYFSFLSLLDGVYTSVSSFITRTRPDVFC
jgi:hypothetical protein